MVVLPHLSERELFLLTTPDDTEEAPWMVMASLQVRDVDLLKAILRLHAERAGLPWVIESYLKVTMPRPGAGRPLDAAPDLLVALGQDKLRSSWSIVEEGKAPEFVLEVVSASSWERDSQDKPLIYESMGVREYALFVPERADPGPTLFGYRRAANDSFTPWTVNDQDILWSEAMGLGLFVEDRLWLRAMDGHGRRLPSPWEVARDEAAARLRAERAQAAQRAAEAEAERLREELRRLREGQP